MDVLLKILEHPMVVTGAAIGAVYLLMLFTRKKEPKNAKLVQDITYKAFNAVEKLIKDGQGGTMGKLDMFLKEFAIEFEKKLNVKPTGEDVEVARSNVEKLVYARNNG